MSSLHRIVRRAVLAPSLAGVLVAAAAPAAAQTFGHDDRLPGESRQDFAFELRFGQYMPAVDNEFGGSATPFRDTFGDMQRWLFSAEFDWQIVRVGPVFSLGLGASAGYTNVSAPAPFADGSGVSTQQTALNVIPTTLVAVARFDGLARHVWWFPIVPYIKGGLAYTAWWITSGSNVAFSTDANGVRQDAWGTSWGFHVAGGLALSLEVFERSMQRQWDSHSGVNHSYLFFELYSTIMPSAGQLNLSTTNWNAGLAVEF